MSKFSGTAIGRLSRGDGIRNRAVAAAVDCYTSFYGNSSFTDFSSQRSRTQKKKNHYMGENPTKVSALIVPGQWLRAQSSANN